MSDFLDFVSTHKAEAYEIDMGKEFGNVWHILRKWQRKLSNAESPEEIQEVRQSAKKAYLSTKEDLLRLLEFQTLTKRHLAEIRIYFEYKDLYEKTKEPKKQRQPKKLPEFHEFFDKGKVPPNERDEFKRKARKEFINDPKELGSKIAECQNAGTLKIIDRSNFSLTNFLKSITEQSWNKSKENYVREGYKNKLEILEMIKSPDREK